MNESSPPLLTHVEVIVNVPIRRSFSRSEQEAPPPSDASGNDDDTSSLQTFTYSLPPALEGRVMTWTTSAAICSSIRPKG